MRAFKFLDTEGAAVISGARWPLPPDEGPGHWVEAAAVRPCREGIHACQAGDLAYWLGAELWEIELGGDIQEARHKVVARRGRLLRRLDGWSGGVAGAMAQWCGWRGRDIAVEVLRDAGAGPWAERFEHADTLREVARVAREAVPVLGELSVGGVAAGLAGDAAALAPTRFLATETFVVACLAAHAATGGAADGAGGPAFAAERRAQSDWIAGRLELV